MSASATFRYRALRRDGALAEGTLEATDMAIAIQSLAARGLLAVEVRPHRRPWPPSRPPGWADLASGLRLLANLLRSGLPLDRALDIFQGCAPPGWAPIIPGAIARIRQGAGLGQALQGDDSGIPPIITSILDAGSAGVGGAEAVERAASMAEATAATHAAVRQALAYPAVLLVTGSASLGFLTFVILPRFAAILADLGQAPPPLTRLVLAGGLAAERFWLPTAALGLGGALAWKLWVRDAAGRLAWDALLRRLPGLGGPRIALASARAAAAMGALLESGVTLPKALAHGADGCGDQAAAAAILEAREAIVGGDSPSRALARSGALTPVASRLARVGEETGRLGPMLVEAARLDQAHAERLIRGAVRLIEPAFILLFGGLVGLVAAALLQALYGVRP